MVAQWRLTNERMPPTLIFDLPNVLVTGLSGLEQPLAARLGAPPDTILPALRGFLYDLVCCGLISEDAYWRQVCETRGWDIQPVELAGLIRQSFARPVPGMETVIRGLAGRYRLVLFADVAAEWASAILAAHPWLHLIEARFFSYELRLTRRDPRAFRQLARKVCQPARQCLVVDRDPTILRAAAAAGLRGLPFTSAEQLAQDLALLSVR